MKKEQLIPEVNLSEGEKEELRSLVDTERAKDGGDAELNKQLSARYQTMLAADKAAKKDKESVEKGMALAKGKLIYETLKAYANETKGRQKGGTTKPSEDSAPVEAYVRKMIKLDTAEEADIKKQVAASRVKGSAQVEADLKEAYRYYTEYNIHLKEDIENLDMQYKVNYLWTRYNVMKKENKKLLNDELKADPTKALELRARRLKEEKMKAAKEALGSTDKVALLDEIKKAEGSKDAEKAVRDLLTTSSKAVKDAIDAVKKAAKDRKLT